MDMLWISEIEKVLGCDEDMAFKVYERMVIDFSECTNEEFEREVRFAYSRILKAGSTFYYI
jgi:hypothetical protein